MSGTPYNYVLGPIAALVVVGLLVLLLRWAFARGGSLVERSPRVGDPDQYGLLRSVAAVRDRTAAEPLRVRLEQAGIPVTIAPTARGLRVMVFAEDEQAARALLDPP